MVEWIGLQRVLRKRQTRRAWLLQVEGWVVLQRAVGFIKNARYWQDPQVEGGYHWPLPARHVRSPSQRVRAWRA